MPRKICENCFKILLTFHDLYELSLQTKERLENIFAYEEQNDQKSTNCNDYTELDDTNDGTLVIDFQAVDEENSECEV